MERVAERRRELRRIVIEGVRSLAGRLRDVWGPVAVVLVGSYARGDSNEWSDVDLLIVVAE